MKKVLRLQKVSAKKGGKPTPKPLTYSAYYSKAHGGGGDSNWLSIKHSYPMP